MIVSYGGSWSGGRPRSFTRTALSKSISAAVRGPCPTMSDMTRKFTKKPFKTSQLFLALHTFTIEKAYGCYAIDAKGSQAEVNAMDRSSAAARVALS